MTVQNLTDQIMQLSLENQLEAVQLLSRSIRKALQTANLLSNDPGDISEKDVFISYVHDDKDFVDAFCGRLDQFGITWFRDIGMRIGSKWRHEIDKALDTVSIVIVIVSPDSMISPWVSYEWHYALLKAGLEPYWVSFKELDDINDEKIKARLSEFQFPRGYCFNGMIDAVKDIQGEQRSLLEWYVGDIRNRLQTLPELKENLRILTYPHSDVPQQQQAAWKLGQSTDLKRTAYRYLIKAVEYQMSGRGYGRVQDSIAQGLASLGDSQAIPHLWRLYQIADDETRKYITSAFHSLSR